jgi:hypothetical protein
MVVDKRKEKAWPQSSGEADFLIQEAKSCEACWLAGRERHANRTVVMSAANGGRLRAPLDG